MASSLWGAPSIHGELLKLGIEVSQATVGRYMPWPPTADLPKTLNAGETPGLLWLSEF